jgi:hypothetical protein
MCMWWLLATGIPLVPCFAPWFFWGGPYRWPNGWTFGGYPSVGMEFNQAFGKSRGGWPETGKGQVQWRPLDLSAGLRRWPPGVPEFGGMVAGLGRWAPSPQPGAVATPPIGPLGILGTEQAEQAGPGIPEPFVIGPGVPGTPIGESSIGTGGAPIGEEGL